MRKWLCIAALPLAVLPDVAAAQFIPAEDSLSGLYPGKAYSPYAERSFPDRVFWGDTHLHTALSMDAGLFGARLGLEDAYRFARGEQVTASSGQPAKLGRPLDWLVIADHSDGMGFFNDLAAGNPQILKFEQARPWYDGLQAGGEAATNAALNLITTFAQGDIDTQMMAEYSPGGKTYASVWEKVIDSAERFNDPGSFTTIIGFEWTSLVAGNNLHRNVLFRDGPDKAGLVVPFTTQAPVGSTDPLDLYAWLENYEATTGGSALAIAHNGNLSNGLMFPVDAQYTGRAIDATYVESRAKWEPLYETTQIKGDGEAHPYLSPEDEFANYETWDIGNLDLTQAKTPEMLQYEYTRQALKNGLLLEDRLGTNPYKFGLVGSTDSHTALSTAEEDNFFGKFKTLEPRKDRWNFPLITGPTDSYIGWEMAASGVTGIWATENTREALWDAMYRRETFATSGPRMSVRFFGGFDFDEADLDGDWVAAGYEKGVPMGADLESAPDGKAIGFLISALKDPEGANLDRVQVIKGWVDAEGETHERVFDVKWSGDRAPGADGKLPPVGNTVNLETAEYSNDIGAAEFTALFTDPEFDPSLKAVYYVRVLEIPTPRWTLYDKARFGSEPADNVPLTHQERAFSSPIWYTP
jgi:hypothetical protein